MAVDPAFDCLALHTVTITPTATRNSYGELASSGTAYTAKAYVDPGLDYSDNGRMQETYRPVSATILATGINVTDVITLPDGSTPSIVNVATYDFVEGFEHTVVRFG